jgi:transposase-like protein
MLDMSKKNNAGPRQVGTATEVRESARVATPLMPVSPARPKRRTFTAEYKQRILREADAALTSGEGGALGELLRREGLYSSHLTDWRRQRDDGELAGLTPRKRGRKRTRTAHADELERLRRRVTYLEKELDKAGTIIDVQKKLSALLGVSLATPAEEDFARAATRRKR